MTPSMDYFMMQDSVPSEGWQWADTPYSLIETPKHKQGKKEDTDAYTEVASTMCVVHNTLLRGLNSIYNQAPNIRPEDYKEFIGYSLSWHSVLYDHHTGEEEHFFPGIEEAVGEKGLLDGSVEEHRSFDSRLEDFEIYLQSLAGRESSFNDIHLNTIIASFAPSLNKHLNSEITDLLALSKYGSNLPIEDLWKEEGKLTVAAMTKFNGLPIFFHNLDVTNENGMWKDWPAIPGVVRWIIMRCLTPWHKGYWKFASCDANGIPKELYASNPRGN